jgi:DNA sulfur modification protein DndB
VALANILPADQLRGLASRKAKPDEFKSVRNLLVEQQIADGWILEKRNKTTSRLRKPKSYDQRFEDRIWILLYRMGFQYLSDQGAAHLVLNATEPKSPNDQIVIANLASNRANMITSQKI